jgi:hypothetical protein
MSDCVRGINPSDVPLCIILQMPLEEKYSGVRGQALAPLRYMLLDTPPGCERRPCMRTLQGLAMLCTAVMLELALDL